MRAEPAVAISENGACRQAHGVQRTNLVDPFGPHTIAQFSLFQSSRAPLLGHVAAPNKSPIDLICMLYRKIAMASATDFDTRKAARQAHCLPL